MKKQPKNNKLRDYKSDTLLLIFGFVSALAVILTIISAGATLDVINSTNRASNQSKYPAGYQLNQKAESRLLFGGDVFWGRVIERRANELNDLAYSFRNLSTLNKDDYDAWVANFECPITDSVVPFDLQWEAIQFNCRPEFLEVVDDWFEIASQANNHSDNISGQIGLDESRQNLEDYNIQHFGHFDPAVKDELCEIVSIPIRINGSAQKLFPVALCGYHGVFKTFTEAELAVIEDYSESFITIIMPHAGAEYRATADSLITSAYRRMVDYGADAVLGNHPHWVQNTEVYKNKLIVYSMGNFIFDQQFNDQVQRSLLIDMTISLDYDYQARRWSNLAESCLSFSDNCLEQAQELGLQKPSFTLSYEAIGSTSKDLITKKASGLEEKTILEQANWIETEVELATIEVERQSRN